MATSDAEVMVGDLVVIMAEPGPFTVIEVKPPYVVIQGAAGASRTVHTSAVRLVSEDPPVAR